MLFQTAPIVQDVRGPRGTPGVRVWNTGDGVGRGIAIAKTASIAGTATRPHTTHCTETIP
jgi:hypothetical protein